MLHCPQFFSQHHKTKGDFLLLCEVGFSIFVFTILVPIKSYFRLSMIVLSSLDSISFNLYIGRLSFFVMDRFCNVVMVMFYMALSVTLILFILNSRFVGLGELILKLLGLGVAISTNSLSLKYIITE